MTEKEVFKATNELLNLALGLDNDLNLNLQRLECSNWDSLKNIEIMLLIEERFGVRLTELDFSNLKSTNAITQVVLKHEKGN